MANGSSGHNPKIKEPSSSQGISLQKASYCHKGGKQRSVAFAYRSRLTAFHPLGAGCTGSVFRTFEHITCPRTLIGLFAYTCPKTVKLRPHRMTFSARFPGTLRIRWPSTTRSSPT